MGGTAVQAGGRGGGGSHFLGAKQLYLHYWWRNAEPMVPPSFKFPSEKGSGVAVVHGGLPRLGNEVAQSHPTGRIFAGLHVL